MQLKKDYTHEKIKQSNTNDDSTKYSYIDSLQNEKNRLGVRIEELNSKIREKMGSGMSRRRKKNKSEITSYKTEECSQGKRISTHNKINTMGIKY